MKKDYQILLCENLYDSDTTKFVNTRVCEIGSSSSKFEGKAYDIHLTHNINGTKELTFKLAKYYFDEVTGEKVRNSLPDMIVNKSILEVLMKDKSYFFTVNKREDAEEGDNITYSFSCEDAFIEELSKTGYGLIFSEQNGLGTIHDLAERVVDGTEWRYAEEKSDIIYETKVELKYNPELMRYDEVEYPIPNHETEYVPELDRYVNKIDFTKTILKEDYADYNGAIGLINFNNLPNDLFGFENNTIIAEFTNNARLIYYVEEKTRIFASAYNYSVTETYLEEKIDYIEFYDTGEEKSRKTLLVREKNNQALKIESPNGGSAYPSGHDFALALPFDYTNSEASYTIEYETTYTNSSDKKVNKTGSVTGKFYKDYFYDSSGNKGDTAYMFIADEKAGSIRTTPASRWGEDLFSETILYIYGHYYRLMLKVGDKTNRSSVDLIKNEQYLTGTLSEKYITSLPFVYNIAGTFTGVETKPISDSKDAMFTVQSTDENKIALKFVNQTFVSCLSFIKNGIPMGESEAVPRIFQLYCYEDSEIITSETVQNVMSNASNFTSTVGWLGTNSEISVSTYAEDNLETESQFDKKFFLQLKKLDNASNTNLSVLYELCADNNTAIDAGQSYAFYYKLHDVGTTRTGPLRAIKIYDGNPLSNKELKPLYEYSLNNGFSPTIKVEGKEVNIYYAIKSHYTISRPYIIFEFDFSNNAEILIERFSIFPIKGRNTSLEGGRSNVEKNNYFLISNVINGTILNDKAVPLEEGEDPEQQKYCTDIMIFPEDTPTAYTQKNILYFYRENYCLNEKGESEKIEDAIDDTLEYLDFEEIIKSNNGLTTQTPEYEYKDEDNNLSKYIEKANKNYKTLEEIKDAEKNNEFDAGTLTLKDFFFAENDNKYYQYYTITMIDPVTKEARKGSKWDVALYGAPIGDRTRTYTSEKSNRFNQIQELGELFEAWPVFEMIRNEDGSISKSFYYKTSNIKDNHIGFHKGINLTSLSREVVSDEIVTKMYVEDTEVNFSTNDGFITIRTAAENPSGENFLYNFKYYVDQNLLNTECIGEDGQKHLMIDYDKDKLYASIRAANYRYLELRDMRVNLAYDINQIQGGMKGIGYQQSQINESITSLEADLGNEKVTESEKENTKTTVEIQKANKIELDKKYDQLTIQYNLMNQELKAIDREMELIQQEKTDKIHAFENKYSQFIKEGVWSGDNYVDNNAYYYDALKVASTSSMPKVTWRIEVIDNSIQEDYKDFVYEVGDLTFLVDNEFFNVPRNSDENYTFKVLISQIEECLDKQSENQITVQNYTTSFEDLFQRIAAATQTLELNEKIYSRAEGFTTEGLIDPAILKKSLEANQNALINSSDNHFNLDVNGLYLQSIENPNKKLRAISEGIFISNKKNPVTDEPVWTAGITADGINASVITAGQVDTSLIRIMSSDQPNFTWGQLGITAHSLKSVGGEWKVNENNFVRLDGFGLYFVDVKDGNHPFGLLSNGKPWYTGFANFEFALGEIKTRSTVSITRDGFLMNIGKEGSNIRLGYGEEDQNEHGLWVTGNGMDISLVAGEGFNFTYDVLGEKLLIGYNSENKKVGIFADGLKSNVTITSTGFSFTIKNNALLGDLFGDMGLGYMDEEQKQYGLWVKGTGDNYILRCTGGPTGVAQLCGFTIDEKAMSAEYTKTVKEIPLMKVSNGAIKDTRSDGTGKITSSFTFQTSNPNIIDLPVDPTSASLMDFKILSLEYDITLDSKWTGWDIFLLGLQGGNFSVDILGNCYAHGLFTNRIYMKMSGDDAKSIWRTAYSGELYVDDEGRLMYSKRIEKGFFGKSDLYTIAG